MVSVIVTVAVVAPARLALASSKFILLFEQPFEQDIWALWPLLADKVTVNPSENHPARWFIVSSRFAALEILTVWETDVPDGKLNVKVLFEMHGLLFTPLPPPPLQVSNPDVDDQPDVSTKLPSVSKFVWANVRVEKMMPNKKGVEVWKLKRVLNPLQKECNFIGNTLRLAVHGYPSPFLIPSLKALSHSWWLILAQAVAQRTKPPPLLMRVCFSNLSGYCRRISGISTPGFALIKPSRRSLIKYLEIFPRSMF